MTADNPEPRVKDLRAISLIHATIDDVTRDRDAWRTLCRKLIVIIIVLSCVLLVALVIVTLKGPTYFATTPTGQITPLIPLDRPTTSSLSAQRFAVMTLTEALSLNFAHWRQQLASVEPRFTQNGYKSFLSEIEAKGWIKKIEQNYLTATATEISRPVLVGEGRSATGVYGYVVEVPLTLTLQSQTERQRQDMKARIVVIRVPTSDKPDGIAVDRVTIL